MKKNIIIMQSSIILLILLSMGLVFSLNIKTTSSDNWHDFYGYVKGAKINDVITAKDSNGIVCGSYKVDEAGKYGFMHVYADDSSTTKDEGAKVGDIITFYYNGVKLKENYTFKGERETTPLNLTLILKDADKDGVVDVNDLCPGTPRGFSVDKNGCSATQFCGKIVINPKKANTNCVSADWKSNEAGKKPNDCQVTRVLFWQYCTSTRNAN